MSVYSLIHTIDRILRLMYLTKHLLWYSDCSNGKWRIFLLDPRWLPSIIDLYIKSPTSTHSESRRSGNRFPIMLNNGNALPLCHDWLVWSLRYLYTLQISCLPQFSFVLLSYEFELSSLLLRSLTMSHEHTPCAACLQRDRLRFSGLSAPGAKNDSVPVVHVCPLRFSTIHCSLFTARVLILQNVICRCFWSSRNGSFMKAQPCYTPFGGCLWREEKVSQAKNWLQLPSR